ncbi:MAG TPA: bifunctional glutamate N-acetyltransferase/amino-acid acetyltransferase ArgJ [Gemmataceae bacterium]|nr:bifunctional glutamate N-acetyltransferase/amino-acid acetyltransferase ArgJ [Gemmataceae bacterium]
MTTDWHLARGYRYAGVHSGLRPDPNRLDLALVVSDSPASAAGVFTQNRVVAAPVHVCRERLPAVAARGVVICSGNANACTGQRGLDDARRMATVAAEALGCRPEQILVCSTGVIGRHLPMPVIEPGIRAAAAQLDGSAAALDRAAHAILTTDTCIKVATYPLQINGAEVRLTGFAKGAAMIGPNMATMLAFVLTDAAVAPADLARITQTAAAPSFNCVSVEGHTSTNDTLLFFANGRGAPLEGDVLARWSTAATEVCCDLAQAIARDAEGASHFVTIEVTGLRTEDEARCVAKAVAESALVKTALFGADPNWGRIVSAAGYADVAFEEKDLSLWLGETLLYQAGTPLPFDAAAVSAYLKGNRDLLLRLRFTLGAASCTFWTCDLTYDYVRLNAEYTT